MWQMKTFPGSVGAGGPDHPLQHPPRTAGVTLFMERDPVPHLVPQFTLGANGIIKLLMSHFLFVRSLADFLFVFIPDKNYLMLHPGLEASWTLQVPGPCGAKHSWQGRDTDSIQHLPNVSSQTTLMQTGVINGTVIDSKHR